MAKEVKAKVSKKKIRKSITEGKIYIQSSFNNTIISITDTNGNVVCWSSSGSIGFKGTKKATPYASQLAATSAIEKAKSLGLKKADVFVTGVGTGRESAIRALTNARIDIELIKDTTPIAHNGCRPKKARRI